MRVLIDAEIDRGRLGAPLCLTITAIMGRIPGRDRKRPRVRYLADRQFFGVADLEREGRVAVQCNSVQHHGTCSVR